MSRLDRLFYFVAIVVDCCTCALNRFSLSFVLIFVIDLVFYCIAAIIMFSMGFEVNSFYDLRKYKDGRDCEYALYSCRGGFSLLSRLLFGDGDYLVKFSFLDNMWLAMKEISSTAGWVSVWKAFAYNFLAFLGAVLLINLWIIILIDTRYRSKLMKTARAARHRAAIAGDVVSSIIHRNITLEDEHRLASPNASAVFTSFLLDSGCFGWRAIFRRMSSIAPFFRSCLCRNKIRQRSSGKYFHYLVPVERTGREQSDLWEENIREIEKSLKRELKKKTRTASRRTQALVDSLAA